jgi:hypothetical protein
MQSYTSLGHREAEIGAQAIRAELVRRGRAAVIAVADVHGELISLEDMEIADIGVAAITARE